MIITIIEWVQWTHYDNQSWFHKWQVIQLDQVKKY